MVTDEQWVEAARALNDRMSEAGRAWTEGIEAWRQRWAPACQQVYKAIEATAARIQEHLMAIRGPLLNIPAGAISPKFDATQRQLRGLMLAAARRRARTYTRRRRHPRHH